MKRRITKFTVIVISILCAELLHEYIHHLLHAWVKESGFKLYVSVLISMAVAVLVFYPAFRLIEKWVHYLAEAYIEGSKKVSKSSYRGIIIGFCVAFFLLYLGFAQVWYHHNFIRDIKNWLGNKTSFVTEQIP